MISRLGQALNFTRKLGQGISTARRIGSAVNTALGGRLLANPLGQRLNDFSKKAEGALGFASSALEKAQNLEKSIRRL